MPSDTVRHLRHACSFLWRTPAFTLPAVAALALGIAVNTTVFSVFNAAILRPLGAAGGSDLVRVFRSARGAQQYRSLSYEEFRYVRAHASSFAELTGHQIESVIMSGADVSEALSAEIVAGSYFAVLRAQPVIGRGFTAADDGGSGAVPVTVISDRFWRSRFAADRAVIGRTVALHNRRFTIVGVAPPDFVGTFPGVATDLWLPAAQAHLAKQGTVVDEPSLMPIARLKDGVSKATAHAELDVLARRMEEENVARDRDFTFVLASARGVHPAVARPLRLLLLLIMAVVAVVLLIACANVASLLLARVAARRGELAVRLALGASRRQLMAQLLLESIVLASLGGVAGLLLAVWPLRILNALPITSGPTGTGLFFDLQLDRRVLLFTAAVTTLTALIFGLVPAVHATRVSVMAALKGSPTGIGRVRSRLRSALVVGQVGLCFVLLVAAGLLFRSVRNSGRIDVGFDPEHVVVAAFDLAPRAYEPARVAAFYAELLGRTRTLPGVERAALADFVPLGDRAGHPLPLAIPGATQRPAGDRLTVAAGRVSADYFATMRQPLLRGREFTPHDRPGAVRVVIVNEALARRFWPGEDALGKRIGLGEDLAEHEIVGIAKNARYASFGGEVAPFVFLPAFGEARLDLQVRTSLRAAEALAAVRRLAHDIDSAVPPTSGQTMREAMSFSLIPARLGQVVFGVAGVIALLLASGGLYGLVCYTLEQRLEEIGIRVALGASRGGVFRVIVGSAVRLAAVGVALGVALAAAGTRLLSALLYGLGPTDPLTFAGIAALLLFVTLAAGYAAARKGLDVDPIVVLRHQ
jgi:predicted permease